ncbi:MAG TPA: class I SAM-dependent methyltransferase [Solirubrobacterales bacterium]
MSEAARRAAGANPLWYHTIELAPGVITPGQVDLRKVAGRILPADLGGRRALDVGTFDGFWAFELERRGASVVAIDVERLEAAEWPPLSRSMLEAEARANGVELGRGFELASEALGSSVERRLLSVYELTPEAIGGPVDFVFSGALLLHLRDPVLALERIASVLRPGGELRLLEPFSPRLTALSPRRPAASFRAAYEGFNWWLPNLATIGAWLRAAGFCDERRIAIARPRAAGGMRMLQVAYGARTPPGGG